MRMRQIGKRKERKKKKKNGICLRMSFFCCTFAAETNQLFTHMKKLFILFAIILMAMTAKAWKVGDFYANDPTGVPAIVVYVDETGEHGLIMAPQALTDKDYKAFCKELEKAKAKYVKNAEKLSKKMGDIDLRENEYLQVVEWMKNAPRYYYEAVKSNKANKAIYADVAKITNEKGEETQNAIVRYCRDNNIELGKYFFSAHWALQLGEGWFIPGNYELELFCKNFSEGLGKGMKYQDWLDRHNEWTLKLGLLALPTQYNGWIHPQALFPDYNLGSSTFAASGWADKPENKGKTIWSNVGPTLRYHLGVHIAFSDAQWGMSRYDKMIDECNINVKFVAFKYF